MDNGKKNPPNILTTNEIRENARNWTLAGDVGLLEHLQQFSESIISKTQETQKSFNQLVDDYEELHTKVGNITNQFLALQNCQFVENRVYDEETPTEEKVEVKVQNEADQEKLILMQYKEVVEVGIKLLDTHFQEVQLPPNSDSDDEDEVSAGNSVIWKPKNPYVNKKFPFLIGSAEWWADDHVGLKPNEEALDKDKILSESESDVESLKSIEKTTKLSSSSSMENIKSIPTKLPFLESTEDLFGFDKNENLVNNNASDDISKGSNSLYEEPTSFLPDFDKEPEAPEVRKRDNSIGENKTQEPVEQKSNEEEKRNPKKVDNEFTRELMAKLVSVTNKTETGVEKKEKIAEVAPPKKTYTEDSLFDETDDTSDLFSTKITTKMPEKSEEKKGLFFEAENDDELFKGENDLFSGSSLFEGEVFKKPENQPLEKNDFEARSEAKNQAKKEEATTKKSLVNDLFDDLDDEDTLFAVKPVTHKQVDKSLPSKEKEDIGKTKSLPNSSLSWGNDEGLFDNMNNEIDDDFFNSSGLFDTKVKKPEEPSIDIRSKNPEPTAKEPNLHSKKVETTGKLETNVQELPKPESSSSNSKTFKIPTPEDLFDDPFGFSSSKDSTTTTNTKKVNILDPEFEDDDDDLFSIKPTEGKKPSVKVTALPEDDDDTALFSEKPKPPDSVSVSSSRSSLFDDVSVSKSRLASVFEKDKPTKIENEDSLFQEKSGKDLFSRKTKEEKSSLFDDCDDGDDLFGGNGGSLGKTTVLPKEKPEVNQVENLFSKVKGSKSEILSSEKSIFSDDSDLFSDKLTPSKPKPPNSLSLKTETKSQTVGKLSIPDNLKNKFESAAKNISGGGTKPPVEEGKAKEEKVEDGLEESTPTVPPSGLLKCPSKDRVKIPGKRRPQSRKARQEAIRNSGTWEQTTTAIQPKESPVASNPLSPSTDEEDFFKVPELDTNFEKEDQSIFKSDLFESSITSKVDDNLLFDGAPVLSPLTSKKKEEIEEKKKVEPVKVPSEGESLFGNVKTSKISSIFDDDDDDDDFNDENLFKASKPIGGGELFQKTEVKKPLFDAIDDDEDDLFVGSHVTPKIPEAKPAESSDGDKKEKGNSGFVDPLGLMTGNQ